MNSRPRYLTKSRFKLGMECPTKLFYTSKSDIYSNENLEDTFLAALAEEYAAQVRHAHEPPLD